MYTETSEAILAPKTIQYAKTSNIFHQNQNQSISLTLSPKSVGSIIDSRCPSHQRIMIPGPSKPFSTLYVDESIHTYIHIYLSISNFNPPNVVPLSFAFPRVQLSDRLCPLNRSERSLPARFDEKAKPPRQASKNPNIQFAQAYIRASESSRASIARSSLGRVVARLITLLIRSRSSNKSPTIANHPTRRSTVDCRSTSGSHRTESKTQAPRP